MQSQKNDILNNNLTHLLDTFTTQNLNTPAKKRGSAMLSHLNLPFSLFKKSPRLIPRNVSGSAWHVATSWWRHNTVAPVDVDGQRDLAGPRGSRWKDGMMIRSLFFTSTWFVIFFQNQKQTKVPLFEKNNTWLLLKWAPLNIFLSLQIDSTSTATWFWCGTALCFWSTVTEQLSWVDAV